MGSDFFLLKSTYNTLKKTYIFFILPKSNHIFQ